MCSARTAHIVPCHYRVRLDPDFSTFEFKGKVEIIIEVTEAISTLVINANSLTISDLTVKKSCLVLEDEYTEKCEELSKKRVSIVKDEEDIEGLEGKISTLIKDGNLN